MTVEELKKLLEPIPNDWKVVLSKDPEGNAYHVWDGLMSAAKYEQHKSGRGDLFMLDEDNEDKPITVDDCSAVVLYPDGVYLEIY